MTYLGQENDKFEQSSCSLNLFEAYFRHLVGAILAFNAFLEFFVQHFCFPKNL